MLEVNKKVAQKFGIDTKLIEEKAKPEKNIEILWDDLTFLGVKEFERTRHVHRLHPYLGKFIPQLVEVFLKKYFKKGDTILDPFRVWNNSHRSKYFRNEFHRNRIITL